MTVSPPTRRKLMACTAVAAFLCLGSAALLSSEGVDRVIRPVLSRLVSRVTNASVAIQHLELSASTLKAKDVLVITETGDEFRIDAVDIRYRLCGMVQREIEEIRVVSPHVSMTRTEGQAQDTEPSVPLPEQFPVTVKEFFLTDGRVRLKTGDMELLIASLDARLSSGARNTFSVSAMVGQGPAVPVSARGSVSWQKGPAVILDKVEVSEQSLLSEPLHLSWTPDKGALGGGRFRIERVDHLMAAELAHALGWGVPLPAGLTFDFSGMGVRVDRAGEHTVLDSRIEQGRVCQERMCLPVERLSLSLKSDKDRMHLEAELGLGHGATFRLTSEKIGDGVTARFRVSVPDLAAKASEITGMDLSVLDGGLSVSSTCRTDGEKALYCHADMEGLASLGASGNHLLSLAPFGGEITLEGVPRDWKASGRLTVAGKPFVQVEGSPDQIQWRASVSSLADLSPVIAQRLVPAWLQDVDQVRSSGRLTGFGGPSWSLASRTSLESIGTTAGALQKCEVEIHAGPAARGEGKTATISASVASIIRTPSVTVAGGMDASTSCHLGQDGTLACQANLRGTGGRAVTADKPGVALEPLQASINVERSQGLWAARMQLLLDAKPVASVTADTTRLSWELALDDLNPVRRVTARAFLPEALREMEQVRSTGRLDFLVGGGVSGNARLSAERVETPWATAEKAAVSMGFLQEQDSITLKDVTLSARMAASDLASGDLVLAGSGRVSGESFGIDLESLRVDGAEFLSTDGLSGFGGGRLEVSGRIERTSLSAPLHLDLKGRAGVGEVLAGKFYADLNAVSTLLGLKASWNSSMGQADIERASLTLENLGELSLTGQISREGFQVESSILSDPLSQLGEILAPALSETSPAVASSHLSGGLAADLKASGTPASFGIEGAVNLEDLSFVSEALGIQARGVSGHIPVNLHSQGKGLFPVEEEMSGRVRIAGLQMGPLALASPDVTLAARPNRIRIVSPLELTLATGQVGLEGFSLQREEGGVGIQGHLTIDGVDLELLTGQLNLPLMKGRIAADLGTIRYAEDVLASDGEATIRVFGGELRVRNLYMDNPFSRFRTLHGDMDFSGLNLHELSQTFEFGEMNGILDGYVHELRLFESTPSRFIARLETREKGKRDISVKALNNLSIISQGGITSVLSRGMYRFIDFYRYRKIGIYCELENDVFTLTGTAREASDRYLVYGGLLPPRIDIVAPGHRISFKEMLKRIKRVDRKRT